jgi:hypothetical protein
MNYKIEVSTRANKKYDVYKDGKYLLSFGDKRYGQYKDKIGHYSHLDNNDEKKRSAYRARHKNDNINDPDFAGYWAWTLLW